MNLVRKSLLLIVGCLIGSSQAIIIRHDVGPSDYEVRTNEYSAVFYLETQGNRKVCVATVIHERWALTAAHCAEETSLQNTIENGRRFGVEVGGRTRQIDALIMHPDYDQASASDVDLALLRFREPSSLPRPVPLQLSPPMAGDIVSLLGWGYFGYGTTGRQYDDGTFRLARNRLVTGEGRLRMIFDDPRDRDSDALELEGTLGLGDSGGPALLDSPTGERLAGIAIGEIEAEGFSEETQGKYGSVAIYENVYEQLDWIEMVVGSKAPFGS